MSHRDIDLEAFHDPVTGLPGARVWAETVSWGVDRGRREGRGFALALLDLDRFDVVADADGRAADRLLKSAAAAWTDLLDDLGVCSRLFSGRFGLLLPDHDLDAALDLVERMRDALPGEWTCSAGIAVWDGEDAGRVAGRVDAALVAAKLHGRDRAVVAA